MGHLHGVDRSSRVKLRWAALRSCLFLSTLFIILYSTTNWITSKRSDTFVWMYEWEKYIPFVPLMIIPYMSIDLFFVGAPFICSDRRELRLLSRRITLCIVAGCTVFLLVPLRMGFERPPADGWLGAIFDWFRGMDKPFNLFPSLHIALRTILAELYARHTRGVLRWTSHIWFSLIGLSTLLTHQHHVIDIVGGFALATICFYVIPDSSRRVRIPTQARLAGYYAAGAIAVLGLCAAIWPYEGWVLIWPATSLALVSAAYAGVGPSIFRKESGHITLAARVLLAPVLIGQWLSLRYYALRSNAWDRLTDELWIGRRLNESEAQRLRAQGISAVVDLTSEFSAPPAFRSLPYLNLQLLDLSAPTQEQIDEALSFIRSHAPCGLVYVHCKAGYSRTAVIAGASLMQQGRAAGSEEAIEQIRAVRPHIVVRPEAQQALKDFESRVDRAESDHQVSIP